MGNLAVEVAVFVAVIGLAAGAQMFVGAKVESLTRVLGATWTLLLPHMLLRMPTSYFLSHFLSIIALLVLMGAFLYAPTGWFLAAGYLPHTILSIVSLSLLIRSIGR
ncbi:hypothetical protein [Tateyamaria sp. ANG-S1]|uniref:hypothetical protein n=1 Tax=Tateyamaria sp. ANG-S1 TaxID=1577905 RepID=UPI001F4C7528|nr:hypothetical protein [Tateyamaria sp. ANG-S1]